LQVDGERRTWAAYDLCCAGYAVSLFNYESEGRTFQSFRARQYLLGSAKAWAPHTLRHRSQHASGTQDLAD